MAVQAQLYSGFCPGGAQDLLMENFCGLNSLFLNVPQQEQHLYMQKTPFLSRYNVDSQQSIPFFSENISAQIENQRWEIDQFITSQNERLRMALQEQRKQQISLFLKSYEPKIQFLLNQKEQEISKARNRTLELEAFLQRLEVESQAWQRAAKENEAMVASLNSSIQRLREAAAVNAAADDAESCCDDEERIAEKCRESRNMVCRSCDFRKSCVIMLPCRHLCSCRDCEAFLDKCPVCNMVKKASIEALV